MSESARPTVRHWLNTALTEARETRIERLHLEAVHVIDRREVRKEIELRDARE